MPSTAYAPDKVVNRWSYPADSDAATATAITTTLYDLLAAIHEATSPEDDRLAVAVAVHLLRSGHATFLGDPEILTD